MAAARCLAGASLFTREEDQHSPTSSSQAGYFCHLWPLAKTPRTPVLVPSCPCPCEYPLTHARTHALTDLVRPGNRPQPSSSRVERLPRHATVLAQEKARSLCGPLLGPGSPPPEPTMPRKSLLAASPSSLARGAFPARKSSELTAASCRVKAPPPESRGLWGLGGGGGGTLLPHPHPSSLFSLLLSMYSSLDLSLF